MAFINLLDIVYPIGTIIENSSGISPADTVGGSWTKLVPKHTDVVELTNVVIHDEAKANGGGGNSIRFYQKGSLVFGSGWIHMVNFNNSQGANPIKILKGLPIPRNNAINPIVGEMHTENYTVTLKFFDSDKTIVETEPGFEGSNWSNSYNLKLNYFYLTDQLPPSQNSYAWKRIS